VLKRRPEFTTRLRVKGWRAWDHDRRAAYDRPDPATATCPPGVSLLRQEPSLQRIQAARVRVYLEMAIFVPSNTNGAASGTNSADQHQQATRPHYDHHIIRQDVSHREVMTW